ncbi:MAG: membrane protein insertion efficiency factor YidD [Opitutales bacterium]
MNVLPARLAAILVLAYQWTLSPLKYALCGPGCGCRFQPTCSCYAREAFLRFGFWRGCYLAVRRILRCHPWHPGGYDPLPSLKHPSTKNIRAPYQTNSDG